MHSIGAGFDDTHCSSLFHLFAHTPDLVAMFDTADCLLAANPAYCLAFHADPSRRPVWRDIMRANHANKRGPVIETDNIESWLTIADARRGTVPYRAFEAQLHTGNWIWITETVSPAGLILFYASDITALRRDSRDLRLERDAARRASWTDPLTGVPNRRYVMDRLEEWMAMQRIQPEFGTHTLAVIDLDDFKQINDRYGHDQGDNVLVAFCEKVVSRLRSFDLFGRIGGEEFLLLMPNCTLSASRDRLNLLQKVIRQPEELSDGTAIGFSFSAGMVAVRGDMGIHDVIRSADKLVYVAKTDGRACVRG